MTVQFEAFNPDFVQIDTRVWIYSFLYRRIAWFSSYFLTKLSFYPFLGLSVLLLIGELTPLFWTIQCTLFLLIDYTILPCVMYNLQVLLILSLLILSINVSYITTKNTAENIFLIVFAEIVSIFNYWRWKYQY